MKYVFSKTSKAAAPIVRRAVYRSLGFFDVHASARPLSPVILCYHGIAEDKNLYSVSLPMFEKQMRYMSSVAQPVSLQEIEAHVNGTRPLFSPSFAVTFDDGYQNILAAEDICRTLRIQPTVFVLSRPAAANRAELQTDAPFLSHAELHRLIAAGWGIGCHSATHPRFSTLTEFDEEIINAKKELETTLGTPVAQFAYPKGAYTPAIVDAVHRGGYTSAYSMDDNTLEEGSNPFIISRIGVNASHTMGEFRLLARPSVVRARRYVKRLAAKRQDGQHTSLKRKKI